MILMRICPLTRQAVQYETNRELVEVTEHGLEAHQWPCSACWAKGTQWHAFMGYTDAGHEKAALANAASR